MHQQLQQALNELTNLTGEKITNGHTDYPALIYSANNGEDLIEGLALSENSIMARVSLQHLATPPAIKSTWQIRGESYRLTRADKAAFSYQLHFEDINN